MGMRRAAHSALFGHAVLLHHQLDEQLVVHKSAHMRLCGGRLLPQSGLASDILAGEDDVGPVGFDAMFTATTATTTTIATTSRVGGDVHALAEQVYLQ